MQDQELRERFAEWARPLQDTVPPPVTVIRTRARRRVIRHGATGAVTLAVAGVATGLVIGGLPGTGAGHPGPAAAGWPPPCSVPGGTSHASTAPAGSPGSRTVPPGSPYLVKLSNGQAQIVDAATGSVIQTESAPVGGYSFTWVAATPGDHEFALAAQTPGFALARFYLLQLNADGTAGSLTQLSGATGVTSGIFGMAVSPDGSELAVATQTPGGTPPTRVRVFDTSGASARTWTSSAGAASALSFAGDGQLGFAWAPNSPTAVGATPEFRTLNLSSLAAGGTGSLSDDSTVNLATAAVGNKSQVTANGQTVLAIGEDHGAVTLEEFSAAGQQLESVPLGTPPGSASQFCGVLWADATGSQVLTQCGTVQAWVADGHATRVHLAVTLLASQIGQSNTFAW